MNLQDKLAGDTPLHKAVRENETEASKYLISMLDQVRIKDKDGWTALHWAAYRGNIILLPLLLAKIPNDERNPKSANGNTPLHVAIGQLHHLNQVKVAHYLIDVLDNVSEKNNFGWSALHWSAKKGNVQIVSKLVGKMSYEDVMATNNVGKTALDLAKENEKLEIVKLLEEQASLHST